LGRTALTGIESLRAKVEMLETLKRELQEQTARSSAELAQQETERLERKGRVMRRDMEASGSGLPRVRVKDRGVRR
jgi:hypothetical protein